MNNQNNGINGNNSGNGNTSGGANPVREFYSEEFGYMGVLLIDGRPFFPATECAKVLGYNQPEHAIKRHCSEDGCMKRTVIDRLGRPQEAKYISEGNLYRLIIRSKLAAAKRFEAWVFDTVLPSIRKFGAYIQPDTLEEMIGNPDFTIALLTELQKEREKNAELAPKARYYDRILQTKNALPVSLIAKDYGMSAAKFNKLLNTLRIQYNVAGTWLLYQDYAGKGYTVSRTYHFGEETASVHTCWTQKGRIFLYNFLAECDVLPLAELLEDVILSGVFNEGGGEDFDNFDFEDEDGYGCALGARS